MLFIPLQACVMLFFSLALNISQEEQKNTRCNAIPYVYEAYRATHPQRELPFCFANRFFQYVTRHLGGLAGRVPDSPSSSGIVI